MLIPRIAFACLTTALVLAAVTDWRQGKVYNALTYPAMLTGLIYWTVMGLASASAGHHGLGALAGLLAGVIPFALIHRLGGLGGGDVKLMGVVGAWSASWACVLDTAIYALLIACAMAIGVMIHKRVARQTFMRMLSLLSATASPRPDTPAHASPTVPFAVAVAIGGILASAQSLLHWRAPWAWLTT